MDTETFSTLGSRVLTFGEPLVVMVPDRVGSVSLVHHFRPCPAGAELNTAVGLARLGLKSSYAGCIGADAFGLLLRRSLQGEGVDIAYLQSSPTAPTGIFFKQWTGLQQHTSVYYYRSNSAMAQDEWNTADAESGLRSEKWDWIHSTGITWMIGDGSAASSTKLLQLASELKIPVSFDVNIRLKLAPVSGWIKLVNDICPFLTWFFVGDEEARKLFGTDKADEVESQLRLQGFIGSGVVVKLGERGADYSSDGQVMHVPAWTVSSVVDTVGAGDGFNAGFIAGILRGKEITEAMRLATVVGAYAVTSPGDHDGYPTWAQAIEELTGEERVER